MGEYEVVWSEGEAKKLNARGFTMANLNDGSDTYIHGRLHKNR